MRKPISILAVLGFCITMNSCTVNKMHTGAFNEKGGFEDANEKNYILKTDGTRIYGDKISWKAGMMVRNTITIDGKTFGFNEVIGYKYKSEYYGRIKNEFIKRIVKGRISIYVQKDLSSVTTRTPVGGMTLTETNTRMNTYHYIQVGETGELKPLPSRKAVATAVKDCPKAYEMANQSKAKLKGELRKNPAYMNLIFDTYNNGCNDVGIVN